MKDKLRDMQRSILPSKARKTARWRKALNSRRTRRKNHRLERMALLDPEVEFGYPDLEHKRNVSQRARGGNESIVLDRRGADKLNHFQRWFYRRCQILGLKTQDERQSLADSILTKDLVGWHAMIHLQWIIQDGRSPHERHFRYNRGYRSYLQELKKIQEKRQELLESLIRDGRLQDLNTQISRKHNPKYKVLGYEWVGPPEVLRPNATPKPENDWIGSQHQLQERRVLKCEKVRIDKGPRELHGLRDIPKFLQDLQEACRNSPYANVQYLHKELDESGSVLGTWRRQQNAHYHPEWLRTLDEYLYKYVKGQKP